MVIRWVTDNSGPWFLHCHIDWHLDVGFAVVMAETETRTHLNPVPDEWDQLCPIFDSLSPSRLGGGGRKSYEEASNITTLLFPPHPFLRFSSKRPNHFCLQDSWVFLYYKYRYN
ncbi:hypothetical protein EV702DRAFT_1111725 [Suillus placidus]|uniref:Plastocyanin-like domain-containing protein n=1 Tax=Suillus placidus TaxID=48579 RepID=A0A9P6ZT47_9AGAM|nr:hypothetical protein EV702DRAFT_1111725 [Suillus placidus]